MKNIKIFLTIVIVISSISCSEDFLEKEPLGKVGGDILYETENGITQMLNSAYAECREVFGFNVYQTITDMGDGDIDKGSNASDASFLNEMAFFNYQATHDCLEGFWYRMYRIIGRCNLVIHFAPEVEFEDIDRGQVIAEARFLRAWAYFNLVRGWGRVPLQTAAALDAEIAAQVVPQSEVDQLYDFLEAELLACAPNLVNDINAARASQGAARGLLAKVYLFKAAFLPGADQSYQDCIDQCDLVTGLGYSLWETYEEVFLIENENGKESLFEIQYARRGERDIENKYTRHQGLRDYNNTGWGFMSPSEALSDFYAARGDVIRDSVTILYQGAGWPGDGHTDYVWDPRVPTRVNKKVLTAGPLPDQTGSHSDRNRLVLRYADVLLMKAEAHNALGQDNLAYGPLNEVRGRAGLADITTETGTDLRDIIWDERRAELACEGHRKMDIRRYEAIVNGWAKAFYTSIGYDNYTENMDELYPIPQREMDFDEGGILEQPQGW